MSIDKIFSKIKNLFFDFVFPVYCPDCRNFVESEKNRFACQNCLEKIKINTYLYCPVCLKKLPFDPNRFSNKCGLKIPSSLPTAERRRDKKNCCLKSKIDFLGFAASYQNPLIRDLIHNFKYRFAKKISFTLASILIDYLENTLNAIGSGPAPAGRSPGGKASVQSVIKENWIPAFAKMTMGNRTDQSKIKNNTLLIPIPLHKKRFNWRGFNQAEEIAKIIGQYFNWPVCYNNLIRIKNTKPQAEIENKKERQKNIFQSFKLKNPANIKDKNIILIDDVSSSGATLEQAACSLKLAGAKTITGIVVAR